MPQASPNEWAVPLVPAGTRRATRFRVTKTIFRRFSNRALHLLARTLPGSTTVRPMLHRLRGVKIDAERLHRRRRLSRKRASLSHRDPERRTDQRTSRPARPHARLGQVDHREGRLHRSQLRHCHYWQSHPPNRRRCRDWRRSRRHSQRSTACFSRSRTGETDRRCACAVAQSNQDGRFRPRTRAYQGEDILISSLTGERANSVSNVLPAS